MVDNSESLESFVCKEIRRFRELREFCLGSLESFEWLVRLAGADSIPRARQLT